MGKNKGKNRGGGTGSITKATSRKTRANDEVDPILAEALARPNVSSQGGPTVVAPSSSKNNNGSADAASDKPLAGSLNAIMLPIEICPKTRNGKSNEVKVASVIHSKEDTEKDALLADSEDTSRTLGNENSLCTPVYDKIPDYASVSSDVADTTADRTASKSPWDNKRASFFILFAGNRKPNNGIKLQ